MKYFRMSYEEVVFRRSYINIMLLNKAIPSYHFDKDDDNEFEDDDEYTAALKKMKKSEKKAKTKHKKPKSQHANDFFEQFM